MEQSSTNAITSENTAGDAERAVLVAGLRCAQESMRNAISWLSGCTDERASDARHLLRLRLDRLPDVTDKVIVRGQQGEHGRLCMCMACGCTTMLVDAELPEEALTAAIEMELLDDDDVLHAWMTNTDVLAPWSW